MSPRVAALVMAVWALAMGPARADLVVEYVIQDGAIPEPLSGRTGDPERGKAVVLDPERGNCGICHSVPLPELEFQGDVGPDLAGVGSRYGVGELRLRVVDSKHLNPDSVMPAYHRVDGLYRVLERYRGEPILSAQEVEDVVAWLGTLQEASAP